LPDPQQWQPNTQDVVDDLTGYVVELISKAKAESIQATGHIQAAAEQIVGRNPGRSRDGAASKLAAGEYVAAMVKLGKAVDQILAAQESGCNCERALRTVVQASLRAADAIIKDSADAGVEPGLIDAAYSRYEAALERLLAGGDEASGLDSLKRAVQGLSRDQTQRTPFRRQSDIGAKSLRTERTGVPAVDARSR
jgi:hypothetical protein